MTTPRVAIRPAAAADAAAIRAIYAPIVERTAVSFEEETPSVEAMARRISATQETYPFLVAEYRGLVEGYAYGSQLRPRAAYRWSVEVTAYVAEQVRGGGFGKALYGELLAALAKGGFHMAFAGIALPNPASVAFHEAMGFEAIGVYREVGFKLGRWHDVGWWQRAL